MAFTPEDLHALLAPIPGDNPAGEPLPFEVREQLEEYRKSVNPEDYPPDDPARPELKRADWKGIIQLTTEILKGSSKDLLLAARLTEALVKEQGFAGAGLGFRLLRRLVEECWDRLLPPIEDDDLEPRAAAFYWLDDPVRGGRFPTTLRSVPVIRVGENTLTTLEVEMSRVGKGLLTPADFEMAVLAVSAEFCHSLFDDLNAARAELDPLQRALEARMGSHSPGLLEIRKALEGCRLVLGEIVARKGPLPVTARETPPPALGTPVNGAQTAAPAAPSPLARTEPLTREDFYAQIASAAAQLQRMEPHSPVPMLIRNAVDLAQLPFPQLMGALARDRLMAALIRDPAILQVLVREFTTIPPPQ